MKYLKNRLTTVQRSLYVFARRPLEHPGGGLRRQLAATFCEAGLSGLLAGKVWHSNLDAELKPLAATLADIADDDGTNIYPSILFVAWRLSRDTNTVDRGLKRLREMGVLEVVEQGGGRGHTTKYRMIEDKFPQRESWKEFRNNPTVGSLITQETTPSTGETTPSTGLNNPTGGVPPVSNPSSDPSTTGEVPLMFPKPQKTKAKTNNYRRTNASSSVRSYEQAPRESPQERRAREAREQVARVVATLQARRDRRAGK